LLEKIIQKNRTALEKIIKLMDFNEVVQSSYYLGVIKDSRLFLMWLFCF